MYPDNYDEIEQECQHTEFNVFHVHCDWYITKFNLYSLTTTTTTTLPEVLNIHSDKGIVVTRYCQDGSDKLRQLRIFSSQHYFSMKLGGWSHSYR